MTKPCQACAGEGVKVTPRKDHEGRYEVRELCMSCIGWGFIEDPPPPPIGCPKVPL